MLLASLVIKMEKRVVKSPHSSQKEKANLRIFKVEKTANKREIKAEIQRIYNLEAEKINVINVPRKKRRLGKTIGWRKGYRKAIVILKHGQKFT